MTLNNFFCQNISQNIFTPFDWKLFKLGSVGVRDIRNSYFYIEKWTFRIMCEVCYRVKRDKKEAT